MLDQTQILDKYSIVKRRGASTVTIGSDRRRVAEQCAEGPQTVNTETAEQCIQIQDAEKTKETKGYWKDSQAHPKCTLFVASRHGHGPNRILVDPQPTNQM